MSWDQQFQEPIEVPGGNALLSLRDAGAYITRLPSAEHEALEWQTAMHCLIEAADRGGPVSFARIGMAQALHRHAPKVFDPARKDPHWSRSRRA